MSRSPQFRPRLATLLIAFTITGIASASTTVFGPKSYSPAAGKPAAVVNALTALAPPECGDGHAYTLVVQNGGGSAPPVSSASILLDGVELIGERDVRGVPETIERTIVLGPASTLSVTVKSGQPGSALSVTVVADVEKAVADPVTFALTGNQQHFETSVAAEGEGPFSVTVRNGDAAGAHRARSGSVTVNGTVIAVDANTPLVRRLVALGAANAVTADLRGQAQDSVTITFARILGEQACGPTVQFTSPAANAVVSTAELLVRGLATGDPSIGVTVNGVGADVDLSHAGTAGDPYPWAALLPVEPGTLQMLARATVASKKSGEATQTVVVTEPPPAAFTFQLEPSTGVAPLNFAATVTADDPTLIALWELDLDGDGLYEISSTTRPRDPRGLHATPGMRTVHARVTLSDNTTREASAVVTTVAFATMDGLLRASWSRFRSALAEGNVDAALAELADDRTRAYYGDGLRLIQSELPRFAQGLADIKAVRLSADTAHYLLVRTEDAVDHGYHIYFVRSSDGVWRIAQF
jgi:hypothetical protein